MRSLSRAAAATACIVLLACGIDAVGGFDASRTDGGGASADGGGSSGRPGSGDDGGTVEVDGGGDDAGKDAAPPPPVTCADVPTVVDAETTLYVGADPAKPWTAYCTGAHETYLPLPAGAGNNFSAYPAERCASVAQGSIIAVTTAWSRVRFDPTTLTVETNDWTFATSAGATREVNGAVDYTYTKLPFAAGRRCENNGPPALVARVDLTGTKFRVASSQFVVEGSQPSGSAAPVGQAMLLTLKGSPAGIHPCRPPGTDPYQRNGGKCLQLEYAP